MFLKLFAMFTLLPALELYLLIRVGTAIGGLNTLILIILSGMAGAWLARNEGLQTLLRARMALQQGILPAEELMDGILILIAGLVLITPGLITDFLGLMLLWPVTRAHVRQFLRKKLQSFQSRGNIHINRFH